MTTTQNAGQAEQIRQAKREIIEELEHLSLAQLQQILSYIGQLRGRPRGMSGAEFVALMRELRDEYQVTDEEFDEFDRILRESDEAEKRRLAPPSHE